MAKRFPLVFLLTYLTTSNCFAQIDSTDHTINHKKLKTYTIAGASGYVLSMTALYHIWYKDSRRQHFALFNDNAEWKQVDKIGHFYSAFYLASATSSALQSTGVPGKRSNLIAAATAFGAMIPIEIFDGFSEAYGASTGDLAANAAGAGSFYVQQLLWQEIRIVPKISVHTTHFANIRPSVLGDNLTSRVLKDYNGQTYWLSVEVDKFTAFPRWLNLAVGYGAEEMVYARDNQNKINGYYPYRQFYLSLDVDLKAIKTRSKLLQRVLAIANMIKIPAPTLSFSSKGTRFYPVYF